jgi:hypothetical protein
MSSPWTVAPASSSLRDTSEQIYGLFSTTLKQSIDTQQGILQAAEMLCVGSALLELLHSLNHSHAHDCRIANVMGQAHQQVSLQERMSTK